jgi:hypothetical protein
MDSGDKAGDGTTSRGTTLSLIDITPLTERWLSSTEHETDHSRRNSALSNGKVSKCTERQLTTRGGGRCQTRRQHPQGGLPSMSSSSSVVATVGPIDSTPKGPAINVFFIFHGGRYRTHWQHNPRVPPSMSSTYLMVATARPAVSTARGPPLTSSSTLVVATVELACRTPGGPPSTSSSTLVVAAVGRVGSNPQGAH